MRVTVTTLPVQAADGHKTKSAGPKIAVKEFAGNRSGKKGYKEQFSEVLMRSYEDSMWFDESVYKPLLQRLVHLGIVTGDIVVDVEGKVQGVNFSAADTADKQSMLKMLYRIWKHLGRMPLPVEEWESTLESHRQSFYEAKRRNQKLHGFGEYSAS